MIFPNRKNRSHHFLKLLTVEISKESHQIMRKEIQLIECFDSNIKGSENWETIWRARRKRNNFHLMRIFDLWLILPLSL